MEIRPIVSTDREALGVFFANIPEGDRTFFKEDVREDRVVRAWSEPRAGEDRLVAVEPSGEITGWLALSGGVGWSDHVGDLRLVVVPSRRREGLGRKLAQHGLLAGMRRGNAKLVVEIVADAAGAISMFEDLGFQPEALLVDHVRDRGGRLRDLVLLAHHAQDMSDDLAAAGIELELNAGTD